MRSPPYERVDMDMPVSLFSMEIVSERQIAEASLDQRQSLGTYDDYSSWSGDKAGTTVPSA